MSKAVKSGTDSSDDEHDSGNGSEIDGDDVPLVATSRPRTPVVTPGNPFSDPAVASHWQRVYEKAQYECRHAFDPVIYWTEQEERAIVRKTDWHVCLWACIMFFALQVDRGNLSQAVSDNMLDQLGLTTDQFNYGNTIFLVAFLVAELPSQLISKALGPDRWIPIQMTIWSLVASAQAFLAGKWTFYITRALLGALEGGFIADLVLWLSYFYTNRELPLRLSFFYTSMRVTMMVTALLAYAILHLDGFFGVAGWRWLFLLEGLLTLSIGVASFFLMPASAVQTKTWFRPKGWFTDREISIVVNRVLRDDPSKGDMHNRMGITLRGLYDAIADYDLWPLYLIGIIAYLPQTPPDTYKTLIFRHLGFSTLTTNLLTIPATAIGIVSLIALTMFSERVNERSLVSMLQAVWTLPCIIVMRYWSGAFVDPWGTFILLTALQSYPYCHAIVVAWCSTNSGSVQTRTISGAAYNMCVQVCNIWAANVYRSDDAPLYRRGNTELIWANVAILVLFIGTKVYYMARNSTKEKIWNGMTSAARTKYISTTKDEGNKRLDFRFAH